MPPISSTSFRQIRLVCIFVALCLLILLASASVVYAATINVDDDCSLANAIRSANGEAQSGTMNSCETGEDGADTISFGRDVALYEALPGITSEVTLEGNHQTLSRAAEAGNLRLLLVEGVGDLTVNNLTLQDGRLSGKTDNDIGAAVMAYAGGELRINNSLFRDNFAGVAGGAIGGFGYTATIKNSLFMYNSSNGVTGIAGALHANASTVTVANSSFNSNSSLSGGAISGFNGAVVTIVQSVFTDNRTTHEAGAIASAGSLSIRASSFLGNSAYAGGGAITVTGNVDIENSTFYGNQTAVECSGGTIALFAATARMRHVTIANSRFPLRAFKNSRLDMVNSVIVGDSGWLCVVSDGSILGLNVNNWVEERSCDSDHWGELDLSPPLGSPPVVPLYSDLHLVARAPDDANCLATDQRGTARPIGSGCDIGAFEGAIPRPDTHAVIGESAESASHRTVCDANFSGSITLESEAPGAQCREVSAEFIESNDLIVVVDVRGYIGAGVSVCFDGEGRAVMPQDASSAQSIRDLGSTWSNGRTLRLG